MSSVSNARLFCLAVMPCLGVLLGLSARPEVKVGGPEIFCVGTTEFQERWPSIPAGGIPWSFDAGPFFDSVAPGLPNHTCHTGFPACERPGIQSMCRAAQTWTDVPVPLPPPAPAASAFRLAANPGNVGWPPSQINVSRMVRDGTNLVTAWQSQTWWTFFGGPQAAASTEVRLSTNPATPHFIDEADIALNVRSTTLGRPIWSFVEFNDRDQRTYAMHATFPNTMPYVDPDLAYGDLEGILAHEFGHFAGLGHSVVDSNHTFAVDQVPTMFLFGHGEPYSQTLSFTDPLNPCVGILTATASGPATRWGGLMGRNNRTLELDDIAAIGEAYPTTAFTTLLGRISGTCQLDTANNTFTGAHIVAQRRDSIDRLRVGTYSRDGGQYTVQGLPPGDYYVYVEPVDQPPSTGGQVGYYFDGSTIPNIVYQGTFPLPSGLTGRGCLLNNIQPRFITEFWDQNEGFSESSPSNATLVQVIAGQTTPNVDFDVVSGADMLTVGRPPSSTNRYSPRGDAVSPAGGPFPTLEIQIRAGFTFADDPVAIFLSTARAEQLFAGQILLPDVTVGFSVNATLDPGGSLTVPVTTSPSLAFANFFIQAAVLDVATSQIVLSNTPNIWIPTT